MANRWRTWMGMVVTLLLVLGGCTAIENTWGGTSPGSSDPSFWRQMADNAPLLLIGVLSLLVTIRVLVELITIARWRIKGIPVLALGDFRDGTNLLPGLSHQTAFFLDNAGMATYDEKGAVPPEFNLLMGTAYTQAELVGRLLRVVMTPRVRRVSCDIGLVDGRIIGCASLTDSGTGFVKYLQVVVVEPERFPTVGDQVNWMAQRLADVVLSELALDANTRGLLLQRLGDYTGAMLAFQKAAEKRGPHALKAAMNLGNLYSIMRLHSRAITVLTTAVERTENPLEVALLQAALACAYRTWERDSDPVEKGAYDWLARQAIDHALGYKVESPLLQYTIACYYALSGNDQEALSRLRDAVAANVELMRLAMDDPDLQGLRERLGHSLDEELGMVPPGWHHPPRKPAPPNIPPGGYPIGTYPIYPPAAPVSGGILPGIVVGGAPVGGFPGQHQGTPVLPPPGSAPESPWKPANPIPGPVAGPVAAPVMMPPGGPVLAPAPVVAPGEGGAPPREVLSPPVGRGNPT